MNKDPYNSITQCLSYILESKFELQIYVFFFNKPETRDFNAIFLS